MTTIKQILKAGRTFGPTKKTPEQIKVRDAQHAARQARQAARDTKRQAEADAAAMVARSVVRGVLG